jgi:predicted lipoprotein with Yx(FWY)xxD motif
MFHNKTVLSWITVATMAALVIAACSPAPTLAPTDTAAPPPPAPTDTAVLPSPVSSDTPASATDTPLPEATAEIPNTGATAEATPMAAPTIMVSMNSSLGQILTDVRGKTLYVYTQDTPGVSNCTGNCATLWPPLTVAQGETPVAGSGVSSTLGTLTRPDGTIQVTVNNLPVYYWSKDANSGDATGQGVGGFWFVLDPSGSLVKGTSATPAGTSATPAAMPTIYP